jgi:hypothetical protein
MLNYRLLNDHLPEMLPVIYLDRRTEVNKRILAPGDIAIAQHRMKTPENDFKAMEVVVRNLKCLRTRLTYDFRCKATPGR